MRLKSWGTLETFSRLVKIHNFKSTGVSWIWRREEAAQLMKKRGGGGGQKLNGPTKQQLVDLSGFCKPPGGNELMFRHTQTLCIYTWNREKKASKSVVLELFWGIFDLIARGTDACICGEWKTSSSAVSCSGQAENSHLPFVEKLSTESLIQFLLLNQFLCIYCTKILWKGKNLFIGKTEILKKKKKKNLSASTYIQKAQTPTERCPWKMKSKWTFLSPWGSRWKKQMRWMDTFRFLFKSWVTY